MSDSSRDSENAILAKKQGVTRAAISARRQRGWTEEEIQNGVRVRTPSQLSRYRSQYSDKLGGYSAEVVAKLNGLSISGLYGRLRERREILLPEGKKDGTV